MGNSSGAGDAIYKNSDAFLELEAFVLFVCAIGFVDRLAIHCRSYEKSPLNAPKIQKQNIDEAGDKVLKTAKRVTTESKSVDFNSSSIHPLSNEIKVDTRDIGSQSSLEHSSCSSQTETIHVADSHSQTTIKTLDELKRAKEELARFQTLANSQNDTINVLRKCLLADTSNKAHVVDANECNDTRNETRKCARRGAARLMRVKRTIWKAESDAEVLSALLQDCKVEAKRQLILKAQQQHNLFLCDVHSQADRLVESLRLDDNALEVIHFQLMRK